MSVLFTAVSKASWEVVWYIFFIVKDYKWRKSYRLIDLHAMIQNNAVQ